MTKRVLNILLLSVFSLFIRAQTVSTFIDNFPGNDGISIGNDGNIYVNVWGHNGVYDGTSVYRVTPDGVISLFANNLSVFPSGSVFDLNDNLLITGWPSGTITRITSEGNASIIANGINGAGGLEIDTLNNIFISEYYNHRILKMDSLGNNRTIFASGFPIQGPSGLTYIEASKKLYVGNWDNGRISVISEDGTVSQFVTLPTPNVGTLMNYGGYLYTTSPMFNQIYRIHIETQQVDLFAGTGALGNTDGDASVATFNFPIGIMTNDGEKFYVSESFAGGGRLRIIENTSVGTNEFFDTNNRFKITPNPSYNRLYVHFDGGSSENIQLEIYDSIGRLMSTALPTISTNHFEVNIESLPTGLYILKINSDKYKEASIFTFIKK